MNKRGLDISDLYAAAAATTKQTQPYEVQIIALLERIVVALEQLAQKGV